ncbi:hypothetical protein [Cupriavidus pauculus]|uniref:hypothetical protein n=1 Tax=Cupriavidus pauculus TaxID=82633 RepID=UPI000783BA25|nr:hypothetical protein [Cupriavidus pauculus]
MLQVELNAVPENFPRLPIPAVIPGAQPKIGVVLSNGTYYAGQTPEERYERWDICEDLAQQLALVAKKDSAQHPEHSPEQTLQRVRISVSKKEWVSEAEMDWLLKRIRTLLAW